jgi:hypothetical protein
MLAIPAPATLPTNCRRDIVNGSSPGTPQLKPALLFLLLGVIYRTEAVNDQAITPSPIRRVRNAAGWRENDQKAYGFALMQCDIRTRSRLTAQPGAEPRYGAAIPELRASAR